MRAVPLHFSQTVCTDVITYPLRAHCVHIIASPLPVKEAIVPLPSHLGQGARFSSNITPRAKHAGHLTCLYP
jgi:hypothetical protein